MPLFSKKFSPVKCHSRQKLPFHTRNIYSVDSNEKIKLKLGNLEFVFLDGEWKPASGDKTNLHVENNQLKELTSQLREENNLLKLKIDVLLDMLTEETMKAEQKKEMGDI